MREFQCDLLCGTNALCNNLIDRCSFANEQMQNHFQSHSCTLTHTHTQMPATINSFSPAKFPTTHSRTPFYACQTSIHKAEVLYFSSSDWKCSFSQFGVRAQRARKLNFDRQTACTLKLISKACIRWHHHSSIHSIVIEMLRECDLDCELMTVNQLIRIVICFLFEIDKFNWFR